MTMGVAPDDHRPTRDYDSVFIGGRWTAPHSSRRLEVRSPATGDYVGSTPLSDEQDVDAAVRAARRAFDDSTWSATPPSQRAELLIGVADALESAKVEILALVSDEMGASPSTVEMMQFLSAVGSLRTYAQVSQRYPWRELRDGLFGTLEVTREPVGVVGAITAWNVPLFLMMNKLGGALAAGCSVILKPAPETPLCANWVGELFARCGLPPGVLSVVPGDAETGAALVRHPEVDKISFTGSTAAGRAIGVECARQFKRCALELGGKSAAIILEDADIAALAPMIVFSGLMNSGQACVAQSRILVPRTRREEIVAALVSAASAMKVGRPDDPAAQLGPLISEKQRNKVESYIASAKQAGATAVLDGRRPEDLDGGYYLEPTIFTDVTNDMVIAREEVFGPVLAVIDYDSEAEAIAIANDSPYGLAGSVWTNDVERGREIASAIRTGTFGINIYANDPSSPFGGYKQSGIGRENGPEGLEAYLEFKSTMLPLGYQVGSNA
jgi:aldehyde dehydrogenase (NAD+)